MTTRQPRDIYRAIMIAAANGRGLRLSADEVFNLSMDGAIGTRAANTISDAEFSYYEHHGEHLFWRDAKPTIQAEPANLAGYHRDDPERLR